jgi:hypothetical protein
MILLCINDAKPEAAAIKDDTHPRGIDRSIL